LISQRFLQSIAVLSFAPALKLNAHFRGTGSARAHLQKGASQGHLTFPMTAWPPS
jgi:hypothetical protein